MKSEVTFEDVMQLCDIIDQQANIISIQNKELIELHQVLAMHGIKIINKGEEKENEDLTGI